MEYRNQIPRLSSRAKAGREHRNSLIGPAMAILKYLAAFGTPFAFFGERSASSSDMAMAKLVRGIGVNVAVHGFRSSFRDWCGEETHFPREICDAALAHATGNAVEAADRRGDALTSHGALK